MIPCVTFQTEGKRVLTRTKHEFLPMLFICLGFRLLVLLPESSLETFVARFLNG